MQDAVAVQGPDSTVKLAGAVQLAKSVAEVRPEGHSMQVVDAIAPVADE